MSKKYVCIHGHFYQPPRENAWLETVEQQEGARPFHDWNERINFECYAPNASARILDEEGRIVKIRNNYKRISWNFGPTLLSWIEENDPEAYGLLQAADAWSVGRFGGHGNALAQVYSHLIMPLANYRDKVTQVHWGIADFKHRFDRLPEGMWLAETAVDIETLEVLASQGIRYTVLAPRQAASVRKMGNKAWKKVHADSIDTRLPYVVKLPSGREIIVFFYNGRVAQEVAFKGLLNNGKQFANQLLSIFDEEPSEAQLAHIATDGESYGHHHRFGEMALADCLNYLEDESLATITNYGQYLEIHPPTWEAKIHEDSSWSCVHGVERWRSNCGCNTGGNPGWNQEWREPLRDALDWLRDQLEPFFIKEASLYFVDPWSARNDYIEVILNRNQESIDSFFEKHARRPLLDSERVSALALQELQRHAMLMYTSCGWFFDEISGIETNQILQYALRAMDYALALGGRPLHNQFIKRLKEAPSNKYPDGAASYLQNVVPTKVTLDRVAMHFAAGSLFSDDPKALDLFNYTAEPDVLEIVDAGSQRLAIGRLNIQSRITRARKNFSIAAIYLGQQHLIGNISSAMNQSVFEEMHRRSVDLFRQASLGETIGVLQEYFGPEKFTLSSLFTEEKNKIIQQITAQSLESAEANFRSVFRDNYQLIGELAASGEVPEAWRSIASYVLNLDLRDFFTKHESGDIRQLQQIQSDMDRWSIEISDPETIKLVISDRIYAGILEIHLEDGGLDRVKWLNELLPLVKEFGIEPDIWRSQNIFYLATKGLRKDHWVFWNDEWENAFKELADHLQVRLEPK